MKTRSVAGLWIVGLVWSAAALAQDGRNYVPEPRPAKTDYLVGVNYFPGWKQGDHFGWEKIEPWPERKPVLGWYDEGSPEVADWEIKWCLEHGITFFNYCWFGNLKGATKQVVPRHGHAIHDGLFKSRYGAMFKFTIMFENGASTKLSAPSDLTGALFPYWLDNYLTHPSYLKADNKPVLFMYQPDKLRNELGGSEVVRQAFETMRQRCRGKGFGGIIIIAMYHPVPPDPAGMKRLADDGYDATSAYAHMFLHYKDRVKCAQEPKGAYTKHIHSPEEAIAMHEEIWQARTSASTLPYILNLTMGWDCRPWIRPGSWTERAAKCRWVIPPDEFNVLCRKAKAVVDARPSGALDSKMLLLDNWNEWGEGHYIAPHAGAGFGYLKAVREVFTQRDNQPDYRGHNELGLGPYDSLYQKQKRQSR